MEAAFAFNDTAASAASAIELSKRSIFIIVMGFKMLIVSFKILFAAKDNQLIWKISFLVDKIFNYIQKKLQGQYLLLALRNIELTGAIEIS
jgi:hypothetical protein